MTDTVPVPIDQIDPVPGPKPRKRNGKALATVSVAPVPSPVSEASAMLALFERLARDPQVDPARIQEFLRMKREEEDRQARRAFLMAFAEMQPELPVVTKRGVIMTNDKDERGAKIGQKPQSKYALWEDINEAIRPVLAKHGFSLSHRVAQPTLDRIVVTAVLGHREGHVEETSMSLPIENSGSKNNVQGWGSSLQYGKRYTGVSILNITTCGEDDDGKAAGADATITDAQCSAILDKIAETGSDTERFCNYFMIGGVAKLPAAKFEHAVSLLSQKARK